ncbi:MAG: hypothetical protein H0X37_15330 [Herpetosiphonaceae bacterium]|nr:hypothetical protein [Herpetosiphonaceae bacterium]
MAYLSLADAKTLLGLASADTSDDVFLQLVLNGAQGAVDRYCGRTFEAQAATRYYGIGYTGRDEQVLYLDQDLYSITSLTNGDGVQVFDPSQYWLKPRNGGPPYGWIELKSSVVWQWVQDGEIVVAGMWGYSLTAPVDVVEAMKELVGRIYHSYDRQDQKIRGNTAAAIQESQGFPLQLQTLLAPFKRSI